MAIRDRWIAAGSLSAVLVTAALILPAIFARPSNCGGNSAALTVCSHFALVVEFWNDDHPGEVFVLDESDADLREQLSELPGTSWLHSAKLLAKRGDLRIDRHGPREVIVVCDRTYDNVPQRLFWRAPMTHAVGYSTGGTGLIDTDEFARLDLGKFIDLRTIESGSTRDSQPGNESLP